jgi:hypothetical protein
MIMKVELQKVTREVQIWLKRIDRKSRGNIQIKIFRVWNNANLLKN